MTLSQNIKRLRQEKGLTQESLGRQLGLSAQAVSKWENQDSYPDGALLVPLAQALDTSLDELFGNTAASRKSVVAALRRYLKSLPHDRQMEEVFSLAWQIEHGLFFSRTSMPEEDITTVSEASAIIDDSGFTLVGGGAEKFFAVFPEPVDGYGAFIGHLPMLQTIFAALSRPGTCRALLYLYRKPGNYLFEKELLAKDCDLQEVDAVMDDLITLRAVARCDVNINGEERVLYATCPHPRMLALLAVADGFTYYGPWCLHIDNRTKPYLPEEKQG